MQLRNFINLLCLILITNCASVSIPDSEFCVVQGKLSAGMDCVSTFSGKARRLNLDETITFLEASVEEKRGAAIVMSSKDFAAIRSSLEALCKIGKVKCKKKHKKAIRNMKRVLINE